MQEDPLKENPFSYTRSKDGKIRIFHSGSLAKTMQGKAAGKFHAKVDLLDAHSAQRLMAKETGQFKFGNERINRNTDKL